MSETQNPTVNTTATTDENCNCCANTDGRNVVNVCAPGNTLYIGCSPQPACSCDDAEETPTDDGDNTQVPGA